MGPGVQSMGGGGRPVSPGPGRPKGQGLVGHILVGHILVGQPRRPHGTYGRGVGGNLTGGPNLINSVH